MDINVTDDKGRTAFYLATIEDQREMFLALLKRDDVDVNVQGPHGNTALIWATLRGRLDEICELLEVDGVDVSVRNKAVSTALDTARKCELFEIASCLEVHSKVCEANLLWHHEELNCRQRKRRRLSRR